MTKHYIAVKGLLFLLLAGALTSLAQGDERKSRGFHIETAEGSVGIRSANIDPRELGVAIYSGARIKPSQNGDDGANIIIDTGKVSTRVLAQKYVSDDEMERILKFYKSQLAKYGPVLECRAGRSVGAVPSKSTLKCDSDSSASEVELKTGTEDNTHIVAVKPSDKGTEIDIAAVRHTRRGEI